LRRSGNPALGGEVWTWRLYFTDITSERRKERKERKRESEKKEERIGREVVAL